MQKCRKLSFLRTWTKFDVHPPTAGSMIPCCNMKSVCSLIEAAGDAIAVCNGWMITDVYVVFCDTGPANIILADRQSVFEFAVLGVPCVFQRTKWHHYLPIVCKCVPVRLTPSSAARNPLKSLLLAEAEQLGLTALSKIFITQGTSQIPGMWLHSSTVPHDPALQNYNLDRWTPWGYHLHSTPVPSLVHAVLDVCIHTLCEFRKR